RCLRATNTAAASSCRTARSSTSRSCACHEPLPDAHPIRRREIQLLARLGAEGLVPGVEVAHRVGAVLGRRVAVGDHLPPQRRLADLLTPGLREAEEEQLLGAEARGTRGRFAGELEAPGVERSGESG